MFGLECKKIFSGKKISILLLVFLFSCFLFFLQLKGVQNGGDTPVTQEIYQIIQGKTMSEAGEVLREEKERVETILGREYEMEEAYRKGEIEADEYIEYRDLYHECNVKREVVISVYERYLQMEKQGGEMVFDLYYNKLFDFKRISIGLLLSIILTSIFLVNCESKQLFSVLSATLIGNKGIRKVKLQVMGSVSAGIAILFTMMEYAIYMWFLPFSQLGMPVQSISVLCRIPFSITIGEWMLIYGLMRIVGSVLLGVVLFYIQYYNGRERVRNRNIDHQSTMKYNDMKRREE